jgi:hypothetical protein
MHYEPYHARSNIWSKKSGVEDALREFKRNSSEENYITLLVKSTELNISIASEFENLEEEFEKHTRKLKELNDEFERLLRQIR